MTDDTKLTLAGADPQDLVDVVCGLTTLGGYASTAGLDDDAERLNQLRKRMIIENRELALAVAEGPHLVETTTGVDSEEFQQGIREILTESD